ncbi:MAG: hypothetical protein K6F00_11030 [Lachnospiraceae bacterium]|nr:hypothetical protein [Lachnospiraceae bacterium]
MLSANDVGEQVEISYSGSYMQILNNICGMLVWSLDYVEPKDLATIIAAVYETCLDEPELLEAWDKAEIAFTEYRRIKWNKEEKEN